MKYTTRQDFPDALPTVKTQYCWHCGAPGAKKSGQVHVRYSCATCGRTSGRVLIYDANMQMHFDNNGRLIHESCGVIITNRAGKLLLFKRTKFPYLLTIPAGHLEIGEAPLTCAGRETEEEIGVRPENLIELFVGDIEGDSCLGGADIHHWYAYGCVVDDAIKVQLDGEGLSWGWYDKQDLSSKNTVQPVMYLIGKDEVTRRLDGLVVSYSSANSTKQLQL